MELNKWFEDYKKYIKFQCEVLPKAYGYGGMKFHEWNFPTFKEFQSSLDSPNYNILLPVFSEEYDYNGKRTDWSNKINYCHRPDLHWVKVTYSNFKGIKHNIKFEFSETGRTKNIENKLREEFKRNYK